MGSGFGEFTFGDSPFGGGGEEAMAITTAGDICQKAVQATGAYGARSPLTDADGELLLSLLNDMMDEWSNYSLICYEVLEQSFPLVPGQASYTIGPGGQINTTRPLKILTDPGTAYVQDSNGNNYNVQVVPRDKWNLYANRSNLVTSNFPNIMFYDPQFPLGIINITPFPTIAYTMFFDSMLQFGEFSSLSSQVILPPGYNLAMWSNLAVLAKPFFLDGQMDPVIPETARRSLGAIKRTNQRENYALYDPEIVSHAEISYNVYTDSTGSAISTS
jgi:hypothetical protein